MSRRAPTLHLVGGEPRTVGIAEVVGQLAGFETRLFLTARAALEAPPAEVVASDPCLPDGDGVLLLARVGERAPGTHIVLLPRTPPLLGPGTRARLPGLEVVTAGASGWTARWAETLAKRAAPSRVLARILEGEPGLDALARDIAGHALSASDTHLALLFLARACPADRILPVLERVVLADSRRAAPAGSAAGGAAPEELYETAVEVASTLGGAGFGVLEELASSPAAPAAVRGRAMRRLASSFPLMAVQPILEGCLGGASSEEAPRIVLEAAEALLKAALRAGSEGTEVLVRLAEGARVPVAVRTRALSHLARDLPASEVGPILARQMRDGSSELGGLASRLMVQSDGLDAEPLAALAREEGADRDARLRALAELFERFPRSVALPVLEACQASRDDTVAARAFELAVRRSPAAIEGALERAALRGEVMQRALLLGALHVQEAGFAALAGLAGDHRVVPSVRAGAVRALGLRFRVDQVAPLLEAALSEDGAAPSEEGAARAGPGAEGKPEARREQSDRSRVGPALPGPGPAVPLAAVLAAVHLGEAGQGLLRHAALRAAAPEARREALEHLVAAAPLSVAGPVLGRALQDPSPAVREAAARSAVKLAGGKLEPVLARLEELGEAPMLAAALQGARHLGLAGFGALAALVLRPSLPAGVRAGALAHLEARFPAEDVAVVTARLEATPGGRAALLASPPIDAHDAATEPHAPAVVVESWEVVATRPTPPAVEVPGAAEAARAVVARPTPRTAEDPGAAEAAKAVAARPTPRAAEVPGVEGSARAVAVMVEAPERVGGGSRHPPPPVELVAQAPARRAPGGGGAAPETEAVSRVPAGSRPAGVRVQTESPRRPEDAVALRQAPAGGAGLPASDRPAALTAAAPAAPERPRVLRSRPIDLPRARAALEHALALGRDGYRGLRALADSGRVPEEVRVQALRHLAADFPDRDVREVLERALTAPSSELRGAALGALVLRRDARPEPIGALAASEEVDLGTRIRAVRFLGARWGRGGNGAVLEPLLEHPDPDLARAALEALFPSLRLADEASVEEVLTNLLDVHPSAEVKAMAARALGVFGAPSAKRALERNSGVMARPEVRAAARVALARLAERERD